MLIVTTINTLTGPNILTVLLEYTNLFDLNYCGNIYKANVLKGLRILGLTVYSTF